MILEQNSSTYLLPILRFELRELGIHVLRVHVLYLLMLWSSEDLNNLNKLMKRGVPWKQGFTQDHLTHNTS